MSTTERPFVVICQGWATLQPEGPRRVLDVDEEAGRVGQDANPPR